MAGAATHYLACDLGAESGRVMLGTLEAGRITLTELHRFPSAMVKVSGTLRWDVLRIFEELKAGLKEVGRRGVAVSGVSTDSWGVDYVLLREGEPLVGVPFHYRDERTDGGPERFFAKMEAAEVFEKTGLQVMQFNTLFQLHEDVLRRPEMLAASDGFLLIADYFNFLMSGVRRAEESLASTTQIYDPRARAWAMDLADRLGLGPGFFPEIVPSGTVLGPLAADLADEVGLAGVKVVAGCSHDTGAAVAAVPAEGKDWAYLSSGTWSLLGIELPNPLITPEVRALNFTNEAGFGGTTRFLKNIVGLWLIQECRREWAEAGNDFTYAELTQMAAEAAPLRSLIRPDAPVFLKPGGMPAKIATYCRETGQPTPSSPGEYVRCAIESLALIYRHTLAELERASGVTPERLHIVGGGSQNELLNQSAADATGLHVLAGPVEATALGNVLIQAVALGHLRSLDHLRETVRDSFPVRSYEPCEKSAWEEAALRFAALPNT